MRAWLWTSVAVVIVGCGPTIVLEDGTEGGSEDEGPVMTTGAPPPLPGTTAMTTSPPPPGTTSPPPPPPVDSGPFTTGVSFLDDGWDDGIPPIFECDLYMQDCPRGEKCMPWANDGGSVWNATRCSPIADDPDQPGEECMVEGSGVSGIDSCELGSMCFYVDPETNLGICVALCEGDPGSPTCASPTSSCDYLGELPLCLPECDPVLQDCTEGNGCYPIGDGFTCVPDDSGDRGAAGAECELVNVCDPGLFCAAGEFVPGCMGIGCCSSFCDLGDAMPPCLPGQVCVPFFEVGMAPMGLEHVGACILEP